MQPEVGAGDDLSGGECDEGGGGLFGEVAEAEPGGARDFLEFFGFVELQVHEDEREVAVAQEEVGRSDCLGGFAAAYPEELLAEFGAGARGIEAVTAVDENDGALVTDGCVENTGND